MYIWKLNLNVKNKREDDEKSSYIVYFRMYVINLN